MDHHGQMQEQKRISNNQDQNTNTKYTNDSAPKHTKNRKPRCYKQQHTNFWPHHPTKTINIAFEMSG